MRRLIKEWKTLGSARFLRVRRNKAADKLSGAWHRLVKTPIIQSRYGVLMSANWSDQTFRFCIDATYGYDLSQLLSEHTAEFTFLDIGSNQGVYSLIACKNSFCRAVYAFEPMPATFAVLQKNIDINHLNDTIVPINAGVSAQCGQAQLSLSPGHTGGASLHGGTAVEQQTVTVELIDHTVMNERLNPVGDIIVKVDVEGHEEPVFEQLVQCSFASAIKIVHYEVDEKRVDPDRLQNMLENLGFNQFERISTTRKYHYDIIARKV